MKGYQASTYGDRWAEGYDRWVERRLGREATDAAVATLADLAGDGPVLELAVGSGRLAIPLAARGLEVHGIEISEGMVRRLRDKPGGDGVKVTVGDMADVAVGGSYSLVYLVYSTLFALTLQAEQVRCMRNVADRLGPDGVFVVEAFVPDPSRFVRGGALQVRSVGLDDVRLEASQHDPVDQRISSQHIVVSERGVELYPMHLRYIWPAELDLMAALAGLRLTQRWASWDRSPFTQESDNHVSVYCRDDGPGLAQSRQEEATSWTS